MWIAASNTLHTHCQKQWPSSASPVAMCHSMPCKAVQTSATTIPWKLANGGKLAFWRLVMHRPWEKHLNVLPAETRQELTVVAASVPLLDVVVLTKSKTLGCHVWLLMCSKINWEWLFNAMTKEGLVGDQVTAMMSCSPACKTAVCLYKQHLRRIDPT